MRTTPPNFAELKGRAVLLMNFLHEQRSPEAQQFSYQFPVEAINVLNVPGMLVNGTAALFWRQGVPVELLRKVDQHKIWDEQESWAYLACSVEREEADEKDARQRLIYPGVIEHYKVVEVLADADQAVDNVVMRALTNVVMEPLLKKLKEGREDRKTD